MSQPELGIVLGAALGIIAGLTPGIHSNTFAALLIAFSPSLSAYIGVRGLMFSIVSSAVSYTVADIIPTTFIGVPDEETAISVLPTHKMVLEGRGFEAVSISAFSSFLSVILSFPLYATVLLMSEYYGTIRQLTPFILIMISSILILTERGEEFGGSLSAWRKRLYAFTVFAISGLLGWFVFERNPANSVLLPLLTGLFGAPVLLSSSSKEIPNQEAKISVPEIDPVVRGTLAGFIVSLFPAISSGIATVLSSLNEKSDERFISAMSAANSSNAVMCLMMLTVIGKTRSGAAVALKGIGIPTFEDLLFASILSAVAALTVTVAVAKFLSNRVRGVRASRISTPVLVFLVILIVWLSGLYGLLIFAAAIPVGMLAVRLGVRRVVCMGCLIVPITARYIL